jgi:mRNA interferase RelE/StbE
MTYSVKVTTRAQRDLDHLPRRVLTAVVEFMFGELARQPLRVGKPLRRELSGLHGARRGPYRILYRVDDDAEVVIILRIAHRVDAYRPE